MFIFPPYPSLLSSAMLPALLFPLLPSPHSSVLDTVPLPLPSTLSLMEECQCLFLYLDHKLKRNHTQHSWFIFLFFYIFEHFTICAVRTVSIQKKSKNLYTEICKTYMIKFRKQDALAHCPTKHFIWFCKKNYFLFVLTSVLFWMCEICADMKEYRYLIFNIWYWKIFG